MNDGLLVEFTGDVFDVETGEPLTGVYKLPSGKIMYSDGTIPLEGGSTPTLKEYENSIRISLPDPDLNEIVTKLRVQGFEQLNGYNLKYNSSKLRFTVDILLYFNTNSITHKISWEHPTYRLNMETGDIEFQGLEEGFELVFGNDLYKRAVAITSDLISRAPFWGDN